MASSNFTTLKQLGRSSTSKIIPPKITASTIDWAEGGKPAVIRFSDGGRSEGSCLRCPDAPCMYYRQEELGVTEFPNFPGDGDNRVCPTNAIQWTPEQPAPHIDGDACIQCGLCVLRCPVAAIHLHATNGAIVQDKANAYFSVTTEPATQVASDRVIERFKGVRHTGRMLDATDRVMGRVYKQTLLAMERCGAQFPNHLSRNLLLGVGIGCSMRRRGDVYVRMDMIVGSPISPPGVVEVEFGTELLDAPRNVIDSLAVLISRYEMKREQLTALIAGVSLPNQRSEYWQLIEDINTVLKIEIGSLTTGALMILNWNRCKIDGVPGHLFYADTSSHSIKAAVERLVKRPLPDTESYPALFESRK